MNKLIKGAFKTIKELSEEVTSYLYYWHIHRVSTCKEVKIIMDKLYPARQNSKLYEDVYLYLLSKYNRAFKTYLHICGNHMPMKYMKKTR